MIIPLHQTTAYTIITPNYLAHAKALQQSYLKNNEGSSFLICVIGEQAHLPATEGYTFIFLNELNDKRIEGMLQRYQPFELSCALKPYYALHIFNKYSSVNRLIYLDGDIHVFGKIEQQTDAAITITPHRTRYVNYLPGLDNFSTTELLRYGVYNAGYYELLRKEETFKFLNWWAMLLEEYAFSLPDKHIFTDQLWLSVIHSFFDDVHINKKPGYNAGFWNLIERTITEDKGNYFINDEPLVFYHYSRYKLELPDNMVDFDHPMFSFSNIPVLKKVFEVYRQSILNEGYEQCKRIIYPYTHLLTHKKKSFWQRLLKK
jgi:hypothetical protein